MYELKVVDVSMALLYREKAADEPAPLLLSDGTGTGSMGVSLNYLEFFA